MHGPRLAEPTSKPRPATVAVPIAGATQRELVIASLLLAPRDRPARDGLGGRGA